MASTYLTRTPSSNGNRKTWTFSAWLKISSTSADMTIFDVGTNGSTNYTPIFFQSNGTIRLYEVVSGTLQSYNLITNRVFRDTSAWYHLVYRVDTTQSTASDRIRLYINGEQITSFSTASYPAQNYDTLKNSTSYANVIGTASDNYGVNNYNGLMSHIHFCDGQSYAPTAFGEYDANGVWKIIVEPSVTYGTNGFFILKDGNSVTDQSPNTNNFTVAVGTLTKTEDSPSNVFATLNPLDNDNLQSGFSNGNTTVSGASSESRKYYCSLNLGMMGDGKYYFESKLNVNNQGVLGVCNLDVSDNPTYLRQQNTFVGTYSGSFGYDLTDGGYFNNNTKTSYGGTSWTANDIISFALDNTNKKMYIAKNGSWVNSGNPSAGTGGIDYSSLGDNNMFIVGDNNAAGYNSFSFNFGNGFFGTTAVASAGTNASGIGIFEYDVPTGYTALSTKGLNL
jgi:hypothetical protein